MFAIALLKKVFNDSGAVPRRPPRGRTLLALEALESRELFSLTPVSPNAGRPFTAIVELQATFPDHRTFVGSGVMVDRFHVLTAGHVVYSYADGGFASQIRATPDLYGNSAPFGVAYMTYERTYSTFMNYNRTHPGVTASGDYDIALITLDRTIGDRTGWMNYGYDNNNSHFAPGAILNTAGYPATGGYNGRYMEFSYGGIAGLSPDGLAINYRQTSITAFAGQSGSPVWRYTPANNSSVVYGIHVGGNGNAASMNFATRITQSIFNDLQNWRAADRTPLFSFTSAAQTNASLSQSFSLSSLSFHSGNAQAALVLQPVAPIGIVTHDNGISTRASVAVDGVTFSRTTSSSVPARTPLMTAVSQMAPRSHNLTNQLWSSATEAIHTHDEGSVDDEMVEALDLCTL